MTSAKVARAEIVYSVNDGGEPGQPLPSITDNQDLEEEYDWPITQLLATLRLNDIVTYHPPHACFNPCGGPAVTQSSASGCLPDRY